MLRLSPRQLRALATRLARDYGFQPSEIDRMTLDDMLWWLEGEAREGDS